MKTLAVLVACMMLFSVGGCVHKISIQQGNYLDEDAIARVENGMTRDQVKLLLGTPMADDPFLVDRWDYVYYFRNGKTGDVVRKRLVVHFENGRVSRMEREDS